MNEAVPSRSALRDQPADDLADLGVWLSESGLLNRPMDQVVDTFCRRLNAAGCAIERVFVGLSTLHPLVRAYSYFWGRKTGATPLMSFAHADIASPVWQNSPFATMIREHNYRRRQSLDASDAELKSPVLIELKASGCTDWYGLLFSFSSVPVDISDRTHPSEAGQLGLAVSFATDRPNGFTDADLALLDRYVPIFALALKGGTMGMIGQSLLATYLGKDPAARVTSGVIQRGKVQSVEAVLFYADLRDFTRIADTEPGEVVVAMLDEYFDCMAQPVVKRGGEVLKFLGDGLLATFGIGTESRSDVCATALDAAQEAFGAVEALNVKRNAAGLPATQLDIALHIGEVLYGNVGTETRLDFTVIGPAVNEASRIELLCKELGQNLLISDRFHDAANKCRGRLLSLGRHELRGVRGTTELFTLAI